MPTYRSDVPQYQYLYERPSAAAFGVGQCLVAGEGYFSDGKNWSSPATPTTPFRTTPVKVITYGDSTALAGDLITSNMNTEVMDVAFPASGNTQGFLYWEGFSLRKYYPQADLVRNCAVGGETTAQMADRDAAVASDSRRAAIDTASASADVIILRGGSINDLLGLTKAQITSSLLDTIYNQHITILNRLIGTGCAIIDEGFLGYQFAGESNENYASIQRAIALLNVRYKGYIESLGRKNIVFLDSVDVVSNPDGSYKTGVSLDGTHLNAEGANALGAAEAKIFTSWFGASSNIRYPGTNLVTNPLLLTQTTPAYGVLATGFSLTPTGSAVTLTSGNVEFVNGVWMQTAVYTPTGTGTAFTSIQAPITISAMGFVDTNTYGFEFDYFVQMMDGSPVSPAATLSARFEVTKTANGKITCLATQRTSGDFISVSEGHIALPLVKINDVAANLTAPALYLSYSPSAAYSIPSKPYKMGVGGVRIVKVS